MIGVNGGSEYSSTVSLAIFLFSVYPSESGMELILEQPAPEWFGIVWILVMCPIVGAMPPLLRNKSAWAIVQGLVCVGLSRWLFFSMGSPFDGSPWDMAAMIGLVVGATIKGRSLHPSSIATGYVLHNPASAGLAMLLGGISLTFFRREQQGALVMLMVFPLVTLLRYQYNQDLIVMTGLLSVVLYFVTVSQNARQSSKKATKTKAFSGGAGVSGGAPSISNVNPQTELKFFREDAGVAKFGDRLSPVRAGQPAAFLSELQRDGYGVPETWVIMPGDDLEPVISLLQPTRQNPAIVRYSTLKPSALKPSPEFTDASPDRPDRWEAFNPNDFRGTIVHAFDRARDPVVLMAQAKIWGVFSGSVQQVMPGYFLVKVGDFRFEVRSNGEVSGEGEVPLRLVTEVASLLQQIQREYPSQIQQQFGGAIVLDWMHDGETLWIDTVR